MIYRKLKHLHDKIRFVYYCLQYVMALAVVPFLKKKQKYQNLWIISERGVEAKDNGFQLFRYIRQHHPKINIRYIISKDSPDREKVAALGETINYRSFRHMLALLLSEVKISTHLLGYTQDLYFFKLFDQRFPLRGRKVYLQHGVTKDALPYDYASEVNLDLFVCAAKREWEFVSETFGFEQSVVRYLGLCRYDQLPLADERELSKVILMMPTWRFYLDELSKYEFKKSAYYQSYYSFLNSEKLDKLLRETGYRLKFCLHHNMQRYMDCFTTNSSRIELVRGDAVDIQECLIEADLLITDYSSVFFDFAYMKKPVLYYQFDREEFFRKHYQQGYFSYFDDGFGPVLLEESEVLERLRQCITEGVKMEAEYKKRSETFFELRDKENCRRNFEAILELTQEGKTL